MPTHYEDVFEVGMPALLHGCGVLQAVMTPSFTPTLCCWREFPDSLIARKRGLEEAMEASRRAN